MPTYHTSYQRATPHGDLYRQVVGLSIPDADGAEEPVFTIPAAPLADAQIVPKVGDFIRDDAGNWWVVNVVGALTDGNYSLTCGG